MAYRKRRPSAYDPNKKWLNTRDLRARELPDNTTLYRWTKAGSFPKPLYMGSVKVWERATIEAWEAGHIVAAPAREPAANLQNEE